jgi:hypothetical protein
MVNSWILAVTVAFAPVYTQPVKETTYQVNASSKEECYVLANWVNNNYDQYMKPTYPGVVYAKCKQTAEFNKQ